MAGALNLSAAQLVLRAQTAGNGASGFTAQAGKVFNLVTVDGQRSGLFANLAEGAGIVLNGHTLQLSDLAGDGNDIALVSPITPNSVNPAAAHAGSQACVAGHFPRPASGGARTLAVRSLDLLPDSSFTLASNDQLNLDDDHGRLFIAAGAVFSGNGLVQDQLRNAGLVRGGNPAVDARWLHPCPSRPAMA